MRRLWKRPAAWPALVLIAVGLLLLIPSLVRADSALRDTAEPEPPDSLLLEKASRWSMNLSSAQNDIEVPQPKMDPCLHCHIAGEEKGLWTQLGRWVLFGSMGMIFVLGFYRSASVWNNRRPWKSYSARSFEWFDRRYEISPMLSKLLSKPVPSYALHWWYCLGGITAFLFITQAFTGIMLAFYYKPVPESAYASIQFIEQEVRFGAAIRAIHHWLPTG